MINPSGDVAVGISAKPGTDSSGRERETSFPDKGGSLALIM